MLHTSRSMFGTDNMRIQDGESPASGLTFIVTNSQHSALKLTAVPIKSSDSTGHRSYDGDETRPSKRLQRG